MLEKPVDLHDEQILDWLRDAFAISVKHLLFLPLGADSQTVTYRAITDRQSYFIKIRRGAFNSVSVTFPRWFSDQGVNHIIPPISTLDGQAWAEFGSDSILVYPFIEGRNGYTAELSATQWHELGTTLKRLHTAEIPAHILQQIPRETYDPRWRITLKTILTQSAHWVDDPVAQALADWLKANDTTLMRLVERTEALATELAALELPLVVCHADIHAGNVLIDQHQRLLIVDWDTLKRAPKEHDLMFIGGAQGFVAPSPAHEEAAFYASYGITPIDRRAIAYYRYERIIQDLAIYGEELLLSTAGGADRQQSLRYAISNLQPGGTLGMADRAYEAIA